MIRGQLGRVGGPTRSLGLGLLSGLLPCGLLWSVLPLAASAGSAVNGTLVMLTLGVCSVPGLALVSTVERRFVTWGPAPRRIAALVVLVLGVWSAGARTGWGITPTSSTPACHEPG
jgi:sulfite exporter TauE/SafE